MHSLSSAGVSAIRLWIDRANACVHQGERPLKLTPKAFAVLRHLMEHAGVLATKDELMAAVWPDTSVSDASLATCIREIRRALGDDPAAPRYIQTVHRLGYRYLGDPLPQTDASRDTQTMVVGRDPELARLARSLDEVNRGARRLIFLGGEPGIGKTTLVEHFLTDTHRRGTSLIARGQCVEQYGPCEAYLPWFDVLNHLARDYGPERLAAVLRRCAPMWLAQLPWLIDANERQRLQHEIAGATRERMIRELAEALEALTADAPLVVVLEDLHWSDPSSIGLLAYLARRTRSARLLLLGTYRPADLHVTSHPHPHPLIALKQELLLHGECEDLRLECLTRQAVADYITTRLPGAPSNLAMHVHQATDGNPLFMVNVIDYLLARGASIETVHAAQIEVPDSLKEMIERQLARLSSDDRRVLEAASVAGAAFSAASVAAILEAPVESAEDRLGTLARCGSFVRATDRHAWPDGTQSDGYAFIHVLYQHVLYERLGTTRCSRMHRLAGERLEAGYGDRAGEIAAELALHFQRGREMKRAVAYLAQAGENGLRRSAYVEAIALLTQGLGLIPMLPEGAERDACELQLRVPLGIAYINTRGYAVPEVGDTFERAHTLCRHVSDTARLFRVLRGKWLFTEQRADLQRARSLAEELVHVAERERDPGALVEGLRILGTTWFHLGKYACALGQVERALALYDPAHHSSLAFVYGQDTGVCCLAWRGWLRWYLGYPDHAATSAQQSVALARKLGHPFSLSYATSFAARLHICRDEPAIAEDYAREAVVCSQEHGLTSMLAIGEMLHGWSATMLGRGEEGVREIANGVARWRSTGALLVTPYWRSLLATALHKIGRTAEASKVMTAAVADARQSDERAFDCEILLLKASISPAADALRDLHRASHLAIEMESPSLRLRVADALKAAERVPLASGR